MKRYSNLDRLLDWLEEHLDEDHASGVIRRNHDAIHFLPVDHVPLSVWVTEPGEFVPVPREQTFDDPERMLYNELLFSFGSVLASVHLRDDHLYQVRSNRGVGLIASLFGAPCRIVNGMPWVDHLEKEALYAAIDRGVPDLRGALGGRVLDDCAYFRRRLSEHPKCARHIHITQPDLQGPFDIAHLLMGPDIFYEVYDDPERLHGLLAVVTETYLQYVRLVRPLTTGGVEGDSLVVHGSLYGGHALIKDDTAAVNLSREQYCAFSGQYNHRILEALGGASLHHCGPEREWHFECFTHPLLRGLNFGQPQFHRLGAKLPLSVGARIPLIGWNHDLGPDQPPLRDFYEQLPATGLTLTCTVPTLDEARRVFDTHLERSDRCKHRN